MASCWPAIVLRHPRPNAKSQSVRLIKGNFIGRAVVWLGRPRTFMRGDRLRVLAAMGLSATETRAVSCERGISPRKGTSNEQRKYTERVAGKAVRQAE